MAVAYMTEDGYKKLKEELNELKAFSVRLFLQIAEARDKGDLSEMPNTMLPKRPRLLEMKIAELKGDCFGSYD